MLQRQMEQSARSDSLLAGREQEPDKVESRVVEVGRIVRFELRVLPGVCVEHSQPSLTILQHQ